MRKTLTFLITAVLPFVGLCASVYWDAGNLINGDSVGYFWTLYMGDYEGGGEWAYMSLGFFVEKNGRTIRLTPGFMDAAHEKWAKRYTQNDPAISEESVKDDTFITNTGGCDPPPEYNISKDGEITFGYATRSDGDSNGIGRSEWVYGWVTFVFEDGVPYAKEGCYVFGADGIYAGTDIIIPRQVPEPGTLSLVLIGIVALSLKRRPGI